MEDKLDLYEWTIDDIDIDGMTAISLVDYPAVEENFVLLSKKPKYTLAKVDNKKNTITGPALIPNKKIYRIGWNGEYDGFFSEETVKSISESFIDKKDNVTIDHNYNANDIVMIESWIVADPKNDKSNVLGFKDLEKGTWMVSYKINNETILKDVEDGYLRGFSIEAYLTEKLIYKENGEELLNIIEGILFNEDLTIEERYTEIDNLLEDDKWGDFWE